MNNTEQSFNNDKMLNLPSHSGKTRNYYLYCFLYQAFGFMKQLTINRRKFLAALSLGTGHILFGNPLAALDNKTYDENPFQLIKLGNSGLKTSLIAMGTGVSAINRSAFLTRQDKQASLDLLAHAYNKGIRFFDCADSYGTHPLMAEALKKMNREELLLSSKIWVRGGGIPEKERPDANIVIDRFRKELNTDYLDLVQLHCMVENDWTDDFKRQMDIMATLKARGIIKAHGVSVHSLPAMRAALASDWVDVIHVRINPYGIAMDNPNPEEVVTIIHQLHNSGKGVIGMKLIGNGAFQNDSAKIENTLKFVLGLKSVDTLLVGFEHPSQIDNYAQRISKQLKLIDL